MPAVGKPRQTLLQRLGRAVPYVAAAGLAGGLLLHHNGYTPRNVQDVFYPPTFTEQARRVGQDVDKGLGNFVRNLPKFPTREDFEIVGNDLYSRRR